MNAFFENKAIAIVGATGVLGSELVRQLDSLGANVHLVVRSPERVGPELSRFPVMRGDVTSRSSLGSAFSQVGTPLDGVINAAGVVAFGPLGSVPEDIVERLFSVNAEGTLNVLAEGVVALVDGGFIASLTGVAADMDLLGMSAYCASKAAAKRAMAIAARELRARKILVLDIRAPHTETGLIHRSLFGEAPTMPEGLNPSFVVSRILSALAEGERDLPSEAFLS